MKEGNSRVYNNYSHVSDVRNIVQHKEVQHKEYNIKKLKYKQLNVFFINFISLCTLIHYLTSEFRETAFDLSSQTLGAGVVTHIHTAHQFATPC